MSFLQNFLPPSGDLSVGYSIVELLFLLGNSVALGIILCVLTYYTSRDRKAKTDTKAAIKLLLGISNILYLCVGLTAVMILVNNNLARAFSIGAAIALVRFRIKLNQKSPVANILFGIVAGIACGLNEIPMAWIVTGIYSFITTMLYLITGFFGVVPEKDLEDL